MDGLPSEQGGELGDGISEAETQQVFEQSNGVEETLDRQASVLDAPSESALDTQTADQESSTEPSDRNPTELPATNESASNIETSEVHTGESVQLDIGQDPSATQESVPNTPASEFKVESEAEPQMEQSTSEPVTHQNAAFAPEAGSVEQQASEPPNDNTIFQTPEEFTSDSPVSQATPTDDAAFIFPSSTIAGEVKPALTIEISESLNKNAESPPDISPRSASASREGSLVYSIDILAEISAAGIPGLPPARSQSAPENGQPIDQANNAIERAISAPFIQLEPTDLSKYLEKITWAEELYVQVLNVAKENVFSPLTKTHSAFKVDPKSARGTAIFGLGADLQVLQNFHSDLPLQTLPGLIDALCVPEFYLAYTKYAQEFRARMDHLLDQAKKNKAFQTLIDSQFPPNMDDIDEDETLFCIFFRPILHLSSLQHVFFEIFQSTDPSTPWFPQFEKLVCILWHLKGLLVQELRLLSQDEIQIHERKEVILKIVSTERRVVFGVDAQKLSSLPISLYPTPIPTVLIGLAEVLYQHQGFKAKGLFRIAPSADESDRAYERIGDGEDAADVTEDVFVASNLIKIWFRELPVALFQAIDFSKVTDETTQEDAGAMILALREPECSFALWILDLCCEVMLEVEVNAMNSKNLAIVFAPNVTPKIVGDPMSEMKLTRKCENLLTTAIEWRAKNNIKFELPLRGSRNRRPTLPASLFVSQSELHGGDTLSVQAQSVTRHSLFSVASFKAHLKGDAKDTMKRSPSANELVAKKATLGKTQSRPGKMSRTPSPAHTPKQAIAMIICASCGNEILEGEACIPCEGDTEAPPPSPSADDPDSEKAKKSRFGMLKNVIRGSSKSPAPERKNGTGPPPPPPLATTLAPSFPLTPTDKSSPGFWSDSSEKKPRPPPPPNTGESSEASGKPEEAAASPGHRSQSSMDLTAGRIRAKEAIGEASALWPHSKKPSLRPDVVGPNAPG